MSKYNKWSNWLVRNGFSELPSKEVFEKYQNKISFKETCSFSERFIKDRYFMFFSDEQIEKISMDVKNKIMSKRKSPYDVFSVAEKNNISIEDAIKLVEDRKSKTSGTLGNFIKRHGEEEGHRRFEIFKQKSAHTKKKFIEKYGYKDGEAKWEEYKKSKGRSKQDFINRYGEEKGKRKWEEITKARAYGSSKEGIINNHGEEYYHKMNQRRLFKNSLDGYKEKYGEEEGIKKWKENSNKKDAKSFEIFLKKNNGNFEAALKDYEKSCMLQSPLFVELKKLYGEDIATQKYRTRKDIEKTKKSLQSRMKKARAGKQKSKGPISKSANKFFKALEEKLGRSLQFSSKKGELRLFNEEAFEVYYYDCFDEKSNSIIEYHGVGFHPKEGDINFVNIGSGKGYQECFDKDQRKLDFASQRGYNVYVVWSDEVKTKFEKDNKIEFLISKLI